MTIEYKNYSEFISSKYNIEFGLKISDIPSIDPKFYIIVSMYFCHK